MIGSAAAQGGAVTDAAGRFTRGDAAAPMQQRTMDGEEVERRYVGQDVPLPYYFVPAPRAIFVIATVGF